MNLKLIIVALVFVSGQNLFAQTARSNAEYFSPELNWAMSVPPGFKQVNANDWDALKSGTGQAVADSLIDRTNTLLVFAADRYNYFESNWQTYNEEERGSFRAHCRAVAVKLYTDFKTQLPEAQIDTAYSTQLVGARVFEKFVLKMSLPNGAKLNSYMYSHLSGSMEFSANLFYLKEEYGAVMLEAWLNSRFE